MQADLVDRSSSWTDDDTDRDDDSSPAFEDSLKLYLRRVGSVPLLTPAEERDLFRRMEAGDECAKRRLIEANLRLVIWIARQYANRRVPLLDLIQEGNLALARAVERFDFRLGCRLSTYACWWIRQAVQRAAASHAQALSVPTNVWRQIRVVQKSQQVLVQRLNREPLIGEIASETGLNARRVAELLDYQRRPVSLETPWEEGQSGRDGLLEDTTSPHPETTAAERLRSEELRTALSALDARLRFILELRFGLCGEPPRSLEEVGRLLGVTRERVRQLEARALGNLRTSAPELREYLSVA